MGKLMSPLPLSLYVHIPWCVRKCPYCDFNSHELKGMIPEEAYVHMLLTELDHYLPHVQDRPLISIFFGGGTPSLFSPKTIGDILRGTREKIAFADNIEITMEANPGTIDQLYFSDYREAGINRLSIGIQSLHEEKLKVLGRIHDPETALRAIDIAKEAGFDNFNLDIMYGLPDQTLEQAMADLEKALAFKPPHFSWYQLTIEPNTLFHHSPPSLPNDDLIWEMQCAGLNYLKTLEYQQYEVSAYSQENRQCVHNLNYWQFGDYLGIGAGAHSKLTDLKSGDVIRFQQVKNPRDYLNKDKRNPQPKIGSEEDLIFEFMLNALRLTDGVDSNLFSERTGVDLELIHPQLQSAISKGLLEKNLQQLKATEHGRRFLNDLVGLFLPY